MKAAVIKECHFKADKITEMKTGEKRKHRAKVGKISKWGTEGVSRSRHMSLEKQDDVKNPDEFEATQSKVVTLLEEGSDSNTRTRPTRTNKEPSEQVKESYMTQYGLSLFDILSNHSLKNGINFDEQFYVDQGGSRLLYCEKPFNPLFVEKHTKLMKKEGIRARNMASAMGQVNMSEVALDMDTLFIEDNEDNSGDFESLSIGVSSSYDFSSGPTTRNSCSGCMCGKKRYCSIATQTEEDMPFPQLPV